MNFFVFNRNNTVGRPTSEFRVIVIFKQECDKTLSKAHPLAPRPDRDEHAPLKRRAQLFTS